LSETIAIGPSLSSSGTPARYIDDERAVADGGQIELCRGEHRPVAVARRRDHDAAPKIHPPSFHRLRAIEDVAEETAGVAADAGSRRRAFGAAAEAAHVVDMLHGQTLQLVDR
jgi:hypothetical protein